MESVHDEFILSPIQKQLIKVLEKTRGTGRGISRRGISRRDLVKQLNVPRTTVYDNLIKLQKRRIVEKFKRNNGLRGAPLVLWKLK